jgi:hypothetical protein
MAHAQRTPSCASQLIAPIPGPGSPTTLSRCNHAPDGDSSSTYPSRQQLTSTCDPSQPMPVCEAPFGVANPLALAHALSAGLWKPTILIGPVTAAAATGHSRPARTPNTTSQRLTRVPPSAGPKAYPIRNRNRPMTTTCRNRRSKRGVAGHPSARPRSRAKEWALPTTNTSRHRDDPDRCAVCGAPLRAVRVRDIEHPGAARELSYRERVTECVQDHRVLRLEKHSLVESP